MTAPATVVIVGAGLAGAKTAEALRDQGYAGAIVLVGDEQHLPYERPPLSKGYLAGDATRDDMTVHPSAWYDEHDVALVLGIPAVSIDPDAHHVVLADGQTLAYDKLVLATGSSPRRLSLDGAQANGVLSLRKVEDSDAIKAGVSDGVRVVMIGGGWIGMEIAANARTQGADVTIIEAADLPLSAALGPELAEAFLTLHQEHGVRFYLGATVEQISVDAGAATGVVLADGTEIPADVVVVGVGAAPNVELAAAAGLDTDNGVLVDAGLRTSDPDIVAVGDIANQEHPVLGSRVRVEHWANALNQPATAAASVLGTDASYDELPYFFSDQYDLGMEYIGYAPPGSYARVVTRGDLAGREFIAFWLDADDRVLAGMNVNVWDVVDQVKALITAKQPVDVAQLTNPDVGLDTLL